MQSPKDGGINHRSRQVNVTWIGWFRGIKPRQKIGEFVLPRGFGHLGGFNYLFIAQKVESVSKIVVN
jgi:hypothetical protein